MNLFAWLFIGHLTGDFIFQTGWMAKKNHNRTALLVHCMVYTFIVYIAAIPADGLNFPAVSAIFFSHLFLDQRKFVRFWVRKVNHAVGLQWMDIAVDQCFHLLVLALIAQYLS